MVDIYLGGVSCECCDGGGNDVPSDCSEELVPRALLVTLQNVSGCACWDGITYNLDYSEANDDWEGNYNSNPCTTLGELPGGIHDATLVCVDGNWQLTMSDDAQCALNSSTPPSVQVDSPFYLEFLFTVSTLNACCIGTVKAIVTPR
jgi:hypothetical protein